VRDEVQLEKREMREREREREKANSQTERGNKLWRDRDRRSYMPNGEEKKF